MVRKRLSGFKTKRDAISAYEKFWNDFRLKPEMAFSAPFGEMFEEWLNFGKSRSKSSTIYSYESVYNAVIKDKFAKTRLCDMTPIAIQKWQDNLSYSYEYTQKIRSVISAVFKYAQRYYDFPSNPMEKVMPKRRTVAKKESATWDVVQFNNFLSVVDKDIYRALFTFLYYTGCRKAEALALTWEDFNLENKTVSITKTYTRKTKESNYKIENTPKTNSSVRTIKLPTVVISAIILLDSTVRQNFVFGGEHPLHERTIENNLKKYLSIAQRQFNDIPSITFHGFRHSHASLLISKGVSIVSVSKRLGHASINETLKTYSHLMRNDEDLLINTLENI